MRLSASLRYAAGVGYEAVELSYVGGALAMVVIVPTEGTFEGFESGLDGARLREIVGSLSPSEVQLRFPRFEFRTQAQLKPRAQRAWHEEADFTGMRPRGDELLIQDVIHEAFVSVDEEGLS